MSEGMIPDEQLRIWALDTAANLARKGTKPKQVIDEAREYYGFMTDNKCDVVQMKGVKR